ncbi:MAG: MFS transporter [Alphaproteobacteria bacterium]|nr:MFS transporter [Alphaproteobacteria bacterium]
MDIAATGAAALGRRTIHFVNIAHALDHFVLLIFPTAVIAIAAGRGLAYSELIGLATGAFVAFGLCSLPAGWLADRIGRRNLLAAFFLGCGLLCLLLAAATEPWHFAVGLLVLGAFTAIYHPVGSAMLVSHTTRLGRDIGINGVWGNLGAAAASGITAAIAAAFGWEAAFAVPGLVCLAIGVLFMILVPTDGDTIAKAKAATTAAIAIASPLRLLAVFTIALVAGGMSFNLATIALPKVIDERLADALPLWLVGSIATAIFAIAAVTQLAVGRLIDRHPLPVLFVAVSLFQPLGFVIAATSTGWPLLLGLVLTLSALYGQVTINDAVIARYVPGRYRAKAFGIRYFLGFTTAGLAVPLIAFAHRIDGFALVLAIATAFGAATFACALLTRLLTRPAAAPPVAAE